MSNADSSNVHSDRLKTLSGAYAQRLVSELETLAMLAEQLSEPPSSMVPYQQLHSLLHSLAGSAGTFGFAQLGHHARVLETQVAALLDDPHAHDQRLPVAQWVIQLQQALDADNRQSATIIVESEGSAKIQDAPSIWFIERDAMLAEYAVQQLKSFGFQVRHFSDAQEVASVSGVEPDVLLVDHRAAPLEVLEKDPVLFWQECLKGFTCPILFTGTDENFTVRLQALRSGGSNYFTKPLDMIKLAASIAQLIKTKDSQSERIVIVEDDVELAQHLQCVLEEAGMVVTTFNKAEPLFEAISEINPELILMDLWLPGITGAETAALLGQMDRWSQIPIVYLSAESNPGLRGQALLRGGDAFLEKPINTTLLINLCKARVARLRKLEHTKNRDALTGLLKHASIKEALQDQWQLARRKNQAFCVVMLDIDHFKRVNDTYGHAVGDIVIAAVGTLLRQRFRSTDKLGRYGGEEFALVLLDCTSDNALSMVNSLREDFAAIRFTAGDASFSCTLSAGVADNQHFLDAAAESLLEKADKALYQAKQSGRNRVCLAVNEAASHVVAGVDDEDTGSSKK